MTNQKLLICMLVSQHTITTACMPYCDLPGLASGYPALSLVKHFWAMSTALPTLHNYTSRLFFVLCMYMPDMSEFYSLAWQ